MSIPQSTAYTVMLKLYLSSDHVSDATGKTVAITLSKAGGAFGNPNAGASNATEVANGWYKFALDTTDTNTLGDLVVRGTAASCDATERLLPIAKATNGGLTALPDTAVTTNASLLTSGTGTAQLSVSSGQVILQTGTGTGQLDFTSGVVKANATQFAGQTITCAGGVTIPAATLASTTNITAGTIATVTTLTNLPAITAGWLTATGIAADAITAAKIADGAIDTATFASGTTIPRVTLADTLTTYTGNTPQTGDSYARIGVAGVALTNVSAGAATVTSNSDKNGYGLNSAYDTEFNAIKAKTDNLPADPAGLAGLASAHGAGSWATAVGFSTLDAAGVRTAVGLGSANLDTQLTPLASCVFDVPNVINANVRYVNGVEVDGAGTSGNPWRPA